MGKPNILIDALPETVTINGRDFSFRTDFRYGILFEQLIQDPAVEDKQKIIDALNLFYDELPNDLEAAVDTILWFYVCGDDEKVKNSKKKEEQVPAQQQVHKKATRYYDYDADAPIIYAAFLDQYGIDLADSDLHWWKFRALFDGLRSENEFCKIVGYRSVDLSKIKNKAERKRLAILKNKYALPSLLSEEEKIAMAGNVFSGGTR